MATGQDAVDLLRSINEKLGLLLSEFRAQKAPVIAPDSDLDSQYGDPVLTAKDPRDWSGPSMVGKHMSECPPEYLDVLAARFDYFAEQAERNGDISTSGKPIAPYKRRDAARARGWAARLRNGYVPKAPAADEPSAFDEGEGEVAF